MAGYVSGDYEKALEYHNKALAIKIMVFGEEHPYAARTYCYISEAYFFQKNYDAALENVNKALQLAAPVFGEDNPNLIYIKKLHALIEEKMKDQKDE